LRAFAIALSLLAAPAYAQVCPVGAPDDTAAIQLAVNAQSYVKLEYGRTYCLNARTGVRIPSDRTLDLTGATVGIFPGCTQHCKAFETVPGSSNVRVIGGTVIGDLAIAAGFSIGARIDSATNSELEGVTFRDWRTDAVWIGGNGGSHNVRLFRVNVDGFGRNGISIVDGSNFLLDQIHCKRALGSNPGACVDSEANPPDDQVEGLTILNSLFEDARVGLYLHAGKGQQQRNLVVIGNIVRNCYLNGIILNSTSRAFLLNNRVEAVTVSGQPLPQGITIGVTMPTTGSFSTAPIWAEDITVAGNTVTGTSRALVLAGISRSKVGPNDLGNGLQQIVSPGPNVPGMAGLMLFTP
jgi:hypothetical protein